MNHEQAFLERHGLERPRCGASFGQGWTALLDDLIPKLRAAGWDGQVDQIKEKFGGLRFYIGATTPETFEAIHKIIDDAEVESYKVCEDCGAPGACQNNGRGWLRTLCPECLAKGRE